MSLPRSDSLPGDGAAQPSVWHFAQTLLLWAIDCIPRLHPQYSTWSAIVPRWPDASRSLWPALMRRAGGQGVRAYDGFDPQSPDYDGLLRRAAAAVHGEDAPKTSRQRRAWAQPLTHCGEHSLRALVGLGARQSHPQFTIMVDLALATVRGILHDGLDRAGFSAIDDQDLRAWLRRHGASEESLASTVLVALYADHMSYESGDVERPAAAAGALLRAALRRYLAFSGALYYTPPPASARSCSPRSTASCATAASASASSTSSSTSAPIRGNRRFRPRSSAARSSSRPASTTTSR
ncbi:hypothetical protein [Nannocystis pusilla]|uniref:hypothetical protein n=1 Tax=Nannocystis pusilla TaxID=889268 RepID=UPI003B7B3420